MLLSSCSWYLLVPLKLATIDLRIWGFNICLSGEISVLLFINMLYHVIFFPLKFSDIRIWFDIGNETLALNYKENPHNCWFCLQCPLWSTPKNPIYSVSNPYPCPKSLFLTVLVSELNIIPDFLTCYLSNLSLFDFDILFIMFYMFLNFSF